MKLQRYEMGDYCSGYVRNDDGDVCISYDVERLEESHRELLDALKGMIALGRQHGFLQTSADYPAIYQANVAISKAEGTK